MIAVVGVGVMGEVFVAGFIRGGNDPHRIVVSDKRPERAQEIADRYGVRAVAAADAVRDAATVLIAVKPQDLADLLAEIGPATPSDALVISVAAGMSLAKLASAFAPGTACIRAMPNTPAVVDLGVTAISPSPGCSPRQVEYARSMLGAVGPVVIVPEEVQDAVTATSGSGPAYVFLLLESMIEAAQDLGLDADTARELATQTVIGAATMARRPGADPALLRQQVTSPNGTTAAALKAFDDGDFRGLVLRAMTAARDRSIELGRS